MRGPKHLRFGLFNSDALRKPLLYEKQIWKRKQKLSLFQQFLKLTEDFFK